MQFTDEKMIKTKMKLTTSPTKRQQIIDAISAHIRGGELSAGSRLATMRDISANFNASLSVVQSAMKELVNSGLVECRGAGGFYVRSSEAGAEDAEAAPEQPTGGRVFLTCHHHADLVWRRTYGEYDKIRDRQIRELERYCAEYPDFHCFFDQSEVVRRYLAQHPERLETLRRFAASGQIEWFGGMCIPDLNLTGGEGLVRNLQEGRATYREFFGAAPELASLIDAFGMCAQVPQILRKSGYKGLLPGRVPGLPPELCGSRPFRWRGLDGSEIVTAGSGAALGHFGYEHNVPVMFPPSVRLGQTIAELKQTSGDVLAFYMTEEEDLDEDLFWLLEATNRSGGRPVTFGRVADFFARIVPERLPVADGELNPTFSGCYTTRSRVKRRLRRTEHALATAEFAAALAGREAELGAAWHDFGLANFHDGACGCHTDAANQDIMTLLDQADERVEAVLDSALGAVAGDGVTVMNAASETEPVLIEAELPPDAVPEGVPAQRDGDRVGFVAALPAWGISSFAVRSGKGAAPAEACAGRSFATRHFDVSFRGAQPVIHGREPERQLLGNDGFARILYRADSGSMWTEQFHSPYYSDCREELEGIEAGPVWYQATVTGEATGREFAGIESLRWRKEFRFFRELDYFTLRLTLDWRGRDTKVSLSIPVTLNPMTAEAVYAVPFGALRREPYFEVPYEYISRARKLRAIDYTSARGDWPALEWVDYAGPEGGIAVANRGVPGWQMVGSQILASLLRSGTHCADGSLVPDPGALDNGTHVFEFAFRLHGAGDIGAAVRLGEYWNRPPVTSVKTGTAPAPERSLLHGLPESIRVSSYRRKGGGLVVRLYETLGRMVSFTPQTEADKAFRWEETDLEEMAFQAVQTTPLVFRPFEIRTFRLTEV